MHYADEKRVAGAIVDRGPAPKDSWRDFILSLGPFVADLNRDIQAGTTHAALNINLENILGMDPSTQTFWLMATFASGIATG